MTGISKGGSTGLNLNRDLYVGGVPDFSSISTLSGFKSGFVGCLSYLLVDGNVVNLGEHFNSFLSYGLSFLCLPLKLYRKRWRIVTIEVVFLYLTENCSSVYCFTRKCIGELDTPKLKEIFMFANFHNYFPITIETQQTF